MLLYKGSGSKVNCAKYKPIFLIHPVVKSYAQFIMEAL